jgi:uncharacterized protein YcaQ
MNSLSIKDARRLALTHQGLHGTAVYGKGKLGVMRCIEQLGYVQIDTISVINRSHNHTLWTRVPTFQPKHLDQLQKEKKVLEYWSHAAAYLPMKDYRYCLPYMQAIASGQKHWRTPDRKAMKKVLERIQAEGPLMARDFEHTGDRGQEWGWNWKPAKIALEQLFIEGQLIATHRVGFQKVYDLPERALPNDIDTSMPTTDEFQRHLIRSAIRAHGFARGNEISYLRKGQKTGVKRTLAQMVEDGEVLEVAIAGIPGAYFTTSENLDQLPGKRITRGVSLLSPFDNAVIQRRRIQQIFDSSYQIECFVPAHKRQFGYFCLPILYGTEIVGRLDPKADRRKNLLIVKSVHIEKAVKDEDELASKLAEALKQLAAFNGCNRISYEAGRKERFGQLLKSKLQSAVL